MNLDGIIVVNKPAGWTSHDVVNRMRGVAGTRRVGHLGTLDPIATGVLPVMIGQATRLARFWERADKTYEAVIRFGFATSTYDRAGEPGGVTPVEDLDPAIIEAALGPMRGDIFQTPPPVSAKKVGGVPAYKLARRNRAVELPPVSVSIYELTLLAVEGSRARLLVRCSAGTYVRSIAHQLGLATHYGAHVESLVRTASGAFGLDQAFTLERLEAMKDEDRLAEALIGSADLLPQFPRVFVDDTTVAQIRHGRDFLASPFRVRPGTEHVKAVDARGELVAIGRFAFGHMYHPEVVLN